MIQILTRPEGGNVFTGLSYRGPDGVQLEEPFGTSYEVTCKHAGYKTGKVRVVFDGKQDVALCPLERIKVCDPHLHNPFDECEPPSTP
jgi:hypothetical protein